MDKMKDYVTESNLILEEYVKNEDKVDSAKGEYISRLLTIKRGMESANTSFLFDKYKVIKISSIELLIEAISEENKNDKEEYLKLVFKSDNESQDELDKLINKNFIQVTYLSLKNGSQDGQLKHIQDLFYLLIKNRYVNTLLFQKL